MAPPRLILKDQQQILVNFLENNREMTKGVPHGSPMAHQTTRKKWSILAKQLNSVQGGAIKTPEYWKKYWFEWRYKCRKKTADIRRAQSGTESGNRFVPLNDLEVRVINLSSDSTVDPILPSTSKLEKCLSEDSNSQLFDDDISQHESMKTKLNKSLTQKSYNSADAEQRTGTPPPRWALELEERRISAEERIANALESIATVIQTQEDRRQCLEQRLVDAITLLAGTVQDINSGVHEAVDCLKQMHPSQTNRLNMKDEFL